MIIHDAKLPPRKGYIEDQDPTTGERYYRKQRSIAGYTTRKVVITNSQTFKAPGSRAHRYKVTLIAGGASSQLNDTVFNAVPVTRSIFIEKYMKTNIIIGQPGEPTSFGDIFAAYEYDEKSKGLTIDGITYGLGETKDHPATQGICIIEYEEPIYE